MAVENSVKVNHKMWFLLLVPIIIWLVFIYFGMEWYKADSLGALFSGLAFTGVAIGLYFQTKQLSMQREDLELQRNEMIETRNVLKAQEEQMKKQKEAMVEQLENQKASRTMDYFLKLLQSHSDYAENELSRNIHLYREDLNLSDVFFWSSHRCVEKQIEIVAIDNVLSKDLIKRELHNARRFVLSVSLILEAYEHLVHNPSISEQTKKEILRAIKSGIPLYQLCLFYCFSVHHKTYKEDNKLKLLIIEYILDNFHKEIVKRILSSKDNELLEKVNAYSEEYFTIMSEGIKESITRRYNELKATEMIGA